MEYKLRQFDTEGKYGQSVLSIKVFGCVMSLHNITAVCHAKSHTQVTSAQAQYGRDYAGSPSLPPGSCLSTAPPRNSL